MAEIVPHSGAMVLLSQVLSHREDQTVCSAEIDEQSLFHDAEGSVASWVGLEYMAQCIAAHGGLVGRANGTPPQVGFLLGSRGVVFHTTRFLAGQRVEVTARRVWGKSPGMVSFDCVVEDATTRARLVEGRLNCFVPENEHALGSET